ncbi:DUF1737 domain-containing protein [Rhodovulum sulfidophilum]|uniref:DUF1737 domain-containing protein n=1 Tax=Rhodovulum sulfidophilum TaxID=35806 RepID=UPI00095204C2|nr:DUF1737 domain-containing protein [Rhodovulum sulfidophilum]MBL3551098.1 DUF1737 domain-containing protein [Rhodovulum sulfidophilum]MBL3595500.1 DUF1737 domain-containing protein [Rhodovulum sulfidophilum]OLS49632.1 hypothetical protein BV379_16005 [Rhodovulum sulfidophilum]
MQAYRLLTGEDSAAFCHKVTAALAQGWALYGAPAYAHDPASGKMRCAQAVVKDVEGDYAPDLKLGEL